MADSFADFVRSFGLRPRDPIRPDGKWHRCPTEDKPHKRNGAWKMAPDGRIGWAQNWATMDEPATWRADEDDDVPEFDVAAYKRRRREERRQRRIAEAEARAYWNASEPLSGGHPYLDAKALTVEGCDRVRVDSEGWLVVPGYRDGQIRTVQRIAPDGTKLFWKGASVSGTCYVCGVRRTTTLNVLAEGFATGLAIYQAVRHARVWVLWNTGNLTKPPDMPAGLTVVAADNDRRTEAKRGTNPGIEAAKQAAAKLGCGVCYPTDIGGSDWADWRVERYDEAMEVAGKWETEHEVRRTVDGRMTRKLMQAAVFLMGGET